MDIPDKDLASRLTAREIKVLRLVLEGCDNQTIAEFLVHDRPPFEHPSPRRSPNKWGVVQRCV